MIQYAHFFYDYFRDLGLTRVTSKYLNMLVLLILTLIFILILDLLVRKVLRLISAQIASRTKSNFDDLLITNRVPRNIAHIPALYTAIKSIPLVFNDFANLHLLFEKMYAKWAGIVFRGFWICRKYTLIPFKKITLKLYLV